jgi:hypothetical protein
MERLVTCILGALTHVLRGLRYELTEGGDGLRLLRWRGRGAHHRCAPEFRGCPKLHDGGCGESGKIERFPPRAGPRVTLIHCYIRKYGGGLSPGGCAAGPVMAARSGRRPVAWMRSVEGRLGRRRGRRETTEEHGVFVINRGFPP